MNITIYSTSTCSSCITLEKWLDKIGQKYEKKITDTDPALMMEFMSVNDGMIGVPFSIVKDNNDRETKISGYDQGKFKTALGL